MPAFQLATVPCHSTCGIRTPIFYALLFSFSTFLIAAATFFVLAVHQNELPALPPNYRPPLPKRGSSAAAAATTTENGSDNCSSTGYILTILLLVCQFLFLCGAAFCWLRPAKGKPNQAARSS